MPTVSYISRLKRSQIFILVLACIFTAIMCLSTRQRLLVWKSYKIPETTKKPHIVFNITKNCKILHFIFKIENLKKIL